MLLVYGYGPAWYTMSTFYTCPEIFNVMKKSIQHLICVINMGALLLVMVEKYRVTSEELEHHKPPNSRVLFGRQRERHILIHGDNARRS